MPENLHLLKLHNIMLSKTSQ